MSAVGPEGAARERYNGNDVLDRNRSFQYIFILSLDNITCSSIDDELSAFLLVSGRLKWLTKSFPRSNLLIEQETNN